MKIRKMIFCGAAFFAAVFLMVAVSGCPEGGGDPSQVRGTNDVEQGPGNRTFYVSMSEGDDSNDGLSEARPIKTLAKFNSIVLGPDDQVFFKRGDIWACIDEAPARFADRSLVPRGRGTEGHPIIISTYGEGNRPIIDGSGLTEAVRIEKTEFIRVQGLEIMNTMKRGYLDLPDLDGPQVRRGVYVAVHNRDYRLMADEYARRDSRGRTTTDYGAMRGIELVDLDIHDIDGYPMHSNDFTYGGGEGGLGNEVGRWWLCGGIHFKNVDLEGNGKSMSRVSLGLPVGRLVNPLVKDCYIHELMTTAIYGDHNPGTWDVNNGDDGLNYAFKGARIEGTVIRLTGSEAICLTNSFWEFEIDRCGLYDMAYLASGGAYYNLGWYMGFIYLGNNSVVQNSEISRMLATGDSHTFDNDIGCFGLSLVQYNYCRDAPGSFLMNWGGAGAGEAGTIVRYNISVNNGGWGGGESTLILNTKSNTYFYNNVFYNDKNTPIRIRSNSLDHAAFVNNVFWTNAATVLNVSTWKSGQDDGVFEAYFDHNAYYNGDGVPTVVSTGTDYPAKIGSWSDANEVLLSADPFGTFPNTYYWNGVTAPAGPGGAGDNENRAGPGYTGIWEKGEIPVGAERIDARRKEIATYFMIDESSPLYQAGRAVTKKEVDDFIWGEPGSVIPAAEAHASTRQRGDKETFNKNGGIDYFGNSIPNPENPSSAGPSIGVHEPN